MLFSLVFTFGIVNLPTPCKFTGMAIRIAPDEPKESVKAVRRPSEPAVQVTGDLEAYLTAKRAKMREYMRARRRREKDAR